MMTVFFAIHAKPARLGETIRTVLLATHQRSAALRTTSSSTHNSVSQSATLMKSAAKKMVTSGRLTLSVHATPILPAAHRTLGLLIKIANAIHLRCAAREMFTPATITAAEAMNIAATVTSGQQT